MIQTPKDELQAGVTQIRWFHSMDLGQGVITNGDVDTTEFLAGLSWTSAAGTDSFH